MLWLLAPTVGSNQGVGLQKKVADSFACTPRRKIRTRFHRCKHTSLVFLVGVFSDVQAQDQAWTNPQSREDSC